MSIILNIETTTKNCSVSLSKNGKTLILIEKKLLEYSHDKKIHFFIDYILRKSYLKFSDINAVCISKGPGSYTGIRIALSIAQGLCLALNIPLLSIDTLKILIQGVFNIKTGIFLPMIYAFNDFVYVSVFNNFKKRIENIQITKLCKESFIKYNQSKIYIIGNGSHIAKKILNISAYYFPEFYPSSQHMSIISNNLFKSKKFENLNKFEPIYLNNFSKLE